ncbi:exosortase Y [Pedobacter boryungensis]|uniref:Archaeosortase/exosortase family protein n=1 Tax=Pedobacter boryungensis TaxID=869962 RepID=A0ABX2DAX1_9SPHI|nr:archaeosortase/exosortase family protein [Pedobacter boryungensis]NQX30161.1 archaeosortase/exosortase family protein [Pedobacter boryungensis]
MNQPLENKKAANKTAIFFVVKLLFFYFLFSQGNLFMNSVMNEGSRFYNAYISSYLDYIQGLKTALIVPAVWMIKLFGFYAIHNEMDVMVVAGPHLRINYSCLGLGVMSFLAAFVIAFPAKLKSKIKLLVFGLFMIYILNVLRIVALGVLLGFFQSQRDNFTYHHEVFNILVYIIVFIVLYYWIKKNSTPIINKETESKID